MEQLRRIITGVLFDALTEMGDSDADATLRNLTTPRHSSQGDLSLPCFSLAKVLRRRPDEISAELAERIATQLHAMDGCEAVASDGGFCNFHVDTEWLATATIERLFSEPDSIGQFREATSLMIEHTSANPNGPFHVGRSRNAILGDTIVRMHRLAGDDVRAEYYVDDMGKQVGILAWALDHLDDEKVTSILAAANMDNQSNYPEKQDHHRVR